MSDREKLIEFIYESDLVCNQTMCEECDYLCSNKCKASMIADYLLANGVTFQKWIPVSERLPEHEDAVLCLINNGQQEILQLDKFENLWVGMQWTYKRHAVTHWMPLPKPPKEENK